MPLKAEVRFQLIRKSALEGGTQLTRGCGRSTSGKEPLPIVLVAEWASWPFWKARNNSPNAIYFPLHLSHPKCLENDLTQLNEVTKIVIITIIIIE